MHLLDYAQDNDCDGNETTIIYDTAFEVQEEQPRGRATGEEPRGLYSSHQHSSPVKASASPLLHILSRLIPLSGYYLTPGRPSPCYYTSKHLLFCWSTTLSRLIPLSGYYLTPGRPSRPANVPQNNFLQVPHVRTPISSRITAWIYHTIPKIILSVRLLCYLS